MLAAAGLSTAAQAQGLGTPTWSQVINTVQKAEDAYRQAPVVRTGDGSIYATGRFDKTITTDKLYLEPTATSAFIIKYDGQGNEQWGVALAGAARINAATADAQGNLYVAGVLADKVILGSTDDKTVEMNGKMDDWGSPATTLSTGFIAKYNTAGELQATKLIMPQKHSEIDNLVNNDMGPWYYSEEGAYFKINHMEYAGGRLYLSASYTGETTIDEVQLQSSLLKNDDFMMVDDVNSACVLSLNATTLNGAKLEAYLKPSASVVANSTKVNSFNFTVKHPMVYVGAIGMGDLTLWAPNAKKDFNFSLTADGKAEYGHVTAFVNTTDGNLPVAEAVSAPANDKHSQEAIGAMCVMGDKLYTAGIYNDTLAYDKNITAQGGTDLFVIERETTLGAVTNVINFPYAEGDYTETMEEFAALSISPAGQRMILSSWVENKSDRSVIKTTNLCYDLTSNTGSYGSTTELTTGIANPLDDSDLATATLGLDAQGNTIVNYYKDVTSNIESAPLGTAPIRLVGEELLLDTPADICIYGLGGNKVLQARQANVVNVTALPAGLYIARVAGVAYKFVVR